MTWKLLYSANSKEDLKSIYEYIAYQLLVPEYAANQVRRIMNAARQLENMPLRHRVYPEEPWKSKQVRYLPVDHFIIFYLPDKEEKTVNIVRIIYAGRDMKQQIFESRQE